MYCSTMVCVDYSRAFPILDFRVQGLGTSIHRSLPSNSVERSMPHGPIVDPQAIKALRLGLRRCDVCRTDLGSRDEFSQ